MSSMPNWLLVLREKFTKRPGVRSLLIAALLLALGLWMWWRVEDFKPLEATSDVTVLEESIPTRLRIPNLKLNTGFVEPLGLTSTNEIEVPESYGDVGWYKFGPTPGELGPAVILGHVDSVDGPAVFWSLGQLKEGDDIYVDRADGTTVHFKITELRRVSQSDFPTQDVYGNIDHVGLRLITCTGIYNHGEQRYSHNLIVFARAV